MKQRFKLIPAVYLVLRRGDTILLARRANTGYQDGKYGMVAGHVDGDEPIRTAMVREAWEEAGIKLHEDDLQLLHVMHRKSLVPGALDERIDFYFAADVFDGEPQIMEPEKCDDMGWFPLDDLPKNLTPEIAAALEAMKDSKNFSEFGW